MAVPTHCAGKPAISLYSSPGDVILIVKLCDRINEWQRAIDKCRHTGAGCSAVLASDQSGNGIPQPRRSSYRFRQKVVSLARGRSFSHFRVDHRPTSATSVEAIGQGHDVLVHPQRYNVVPSLSALTTSLNVFGFSVDGVKRVCSTRIRYGWPKRRRNPHAALLPT